MRTLFNLPFPSPTDPLILFCVSAGFWVGAEPPAENTAGASFPWLICRRTWMSTLRTLPSRTTVQGTTLRGAGLRRCPSGGWQALRRLQFHSFICCLFQCIVHFTEYMCQAPPGTRNSKINHQVFPS